MKHQTIRATVTLLLTTTLFIALSSTGHSQIYDQIMDILNGAEHCFDHSSVGYHEALGTISVRSGNTNGIRWEAVRPSGALISSGVASGNLTANQLTYSSLGLGTIFRLATPSYYFGFVHKGPWAVSPFTIKGSIYAPRPGIQCPYLDCWSPTPADILEAEIGIYTYDSPNYILSLQSALYLPGKSKITVKDVYGNPLSDVPVYLTGYDYQRFNPELRNTNTSGEVEYCIPNAIREDDWSVPSIWSPVDNALKKEVRGFLLVDHKGFYHTADLDGDFSAGEERDITIPADSIATIYRLGQPKPNQAVYVTDANLTEVMSQYPISTNAIGQATFAVPTGSQFRFLVQDTDGTQSISAILTAPSNGTVTMIAQNTPTLSLPSNGATFDIADSVNFSWNNAGGATAKYAWFYRHSSNSTFSGYNVTGTSLNGVQFNGTGTWYWLVQAYDSSNNVIAQSATRTFTITDSSSQSQSMSSRQRQLSNSASVNVTQNLESIDEQPSPLSQSESVAEQIEEMEMLIIEELLNENLFDDDIE